LVGQLASLQQQLAAAAAAAANAGANAPASAAVEKALAEANKRAERLSAQVSAKDREIAGLADKLEAALQAAADATTAATAAAAQGSMAGLKGGASDNAAKQAIAQAQQQVWRLFGYGGELGPAVIYCKISHFPSCTPFACCYAITQAQQLVTGRSVEVVGWGPASAAWVVSMLCSENPGPFLSCSCVVLHPDVLCCVMRVAG
jgi:hypothetical protein